MAQTKVEITAEDKTAAAFKSAERNLNAWSNKMSSLQGLMAGVATGAMAALINKGLTFADTLDELSKKTGFTTTRLQELQYAGSQLGAKQEDVNEALLRFTRTVGEAAHGSDQAREALARVGISVDDLKRKSLEQLFDQAQRTLARTTSETQRLAAANDVFGRGAKNVANLLSAQGDEMATLTRQAHEMGAVLSKESIAKAKETKDKFEALSRVISVQLSEAVVAIAPLLTNMASGLSNLAQWSNHIAKGLGLIARSTEEEYVALLQTRQRLADSIEGTEGALSSWLNRLIGPSDAAKQRLASLRAELALVDKQLAESRDKMAAEKDKAPTQKAAVDSVDQSAKEKAQQQQDELQAKRDADKAAKEDQRLIDERLRLDQHYADRLTRIQESFLTEDALELQRYQERQAVIDANFELGRISEEERNRLMEEVELQHQARMGNIAAQGILDRRKFEEMNATQKRQFILSEMIAMTQGVAAQNKTLFKINKLATIASLALDMPAAIGAAIERGGGLPWGAVFGAMTAAKYVALIAQANSAKFGSATSAPSVAGGTAVPVTQAETIPSLVPAPAQAQRNVTLVLQGEGAPSDDYIRRVLIPGFKEAFGDGLRFEMQMA